MSEEKDSCLSVLKVFFRNLILFTLASFMGNFLFIQCQQDDPEWINYLERQEKGN